MIDCSTTKNYFKERARMTKTDINGKCHGVCDDCPFSIFKNGLYISCNNLEVAYPDTAIAIVQKWSDEHKQKTYKDDFFEKFPNALKGHYGTPRCCRKNVYGEEKSDGCDSNDVECCKCWNEAMPE